MMANYFLLPIKFSILVIIRLVMKALKVTFTPLLSSESGTLASSLLRRVKAHKMLTTLYTKVTLEKLEIRSDDNIFLLLGMARFTALRWCNVIGVQLMKHDCKCCSNN